MRNKIKLVLLVLSFTLAFPALSAMAEDAPVTGSQKRPQTTETEKVKKIQPADQFRVAKGIRQLMSTHLKKQGKNLVRAEQTIQRIELQANKVPDVDKTAFNASLEKTKKLVLEAKDLLAAANTKYGKVSQNQAIAKADLKAFIADMRALQAKFKEIKQAALNSIKELKAVEKKALENRKLNKAEKTKKNDGSAVRKESK